MDVEEYNMQDLFEDEADDRDGSGDEAEEDRNDDGERSEAQLELGGKEGDSKGPEGTVIVKKRIIRNPQPKLDPDRILGPRGVPILEDIFKDFKPKGKGEEFRDLDIVMKRMEHWAHRLYPKLPFEDVMNRISQLGKKKTVQVNLKKIRMGMPTFVDRPDIDDDDDKETPQQIQADQELIQRYDDNMGDDDDALFDEMMKEAQASSQNSRPNASQIQTPNTTLSDEQRERMIRNRQIAEEKRKAKLAEKQRLESGLAQSQSDIRDGEETRTFIENDSTITDHAVQSVTDVSELIESTRNDVTNEDPETLNNDDTNHDAQEPAVDDVTSHEIQDPTDNDVTSHEIQDPTDNDVTNEMGKENNTYDITNEKVQDTTNDDDDMDCDGQLQIVEGENDDVV